MCTEGSLRALRAGLTGTLGTLSKTGGGGSTLGKGTLKSATNILKEWETRTHESWIKLLYDVERIPVEEVQHLNLLLSKGMPRSVPTPAAVAATATAAIAHACFRVCGIADDLLVRRRSLAFGYGIGVGVRCRCRLWRLRRLR